MKNTLDASFLKPSLNLSQSDINNSPLRIKNSDRLYKKEEKENSQYVMNKNIISVKSYQRKANEDDFCTF